ncbi:hypothetical protein DEI99_004920 [Curtobacterium sp. MCLR17_036]|uniref:hypothetical protein n=1 Tax=Curtobacterium sp. MCLR17_036 TaxID=2175620 RepID=UPI0024DF3883|nr:hypothetical protein [Curtobacterium sp. MCLR17_036]WIE65885.1 hypothetical protein DEI99_004920 [Curtobacterium sp. MCLR17_036]
MGFLDRLLGRPDRDRTGDAQQNQWGQPQQQGYQYGQQSYQQPVQQSAPSGAPAATDDERAVERYRYLLRTAPPERIEEVHAEAFATLTDEQRRMVFDEFTRTAPAGEAPRGDDPRSLAQAVTRSEIMSAFLPDPGSFDGGTDAAGEGGSEDTGAESGDGGASDGGGTDGGGFESAGWGDGGSDFGGGGGFGDFGGDFDV